MNKQEFEELALDLKQYAVGGEYPNNETYRIPFTILDKTPGGQSYGRIMWNIEILTGTKKTGGWSDKHKRYWVEKIYLWASQTRDKRISGKVFKLDIFCEAFRNHMNKIEITSIEPCSLHKNGTVISFYPNNTDSNESILEISATTSVGFGVNFINK